LSVKRLLAQGVAPDLVELASATSGPPVPPLRTLLASFPKRIGEFVVCRNKASSRASLLAALIMRSWASRLPDKVELFDIFQFCPCSLAMFSKS
jgi:hypothetical protein